MSKEILRLEKVSIPHYLDEVDFYVKKGEIVGLLPINNLGLNHLINVICNGISIHYGFVTYNGKRVNDYLMTKSTKNNVAYITKNTTLIDTLSVYENLFVIRKGFSHYIIHKKTLLHQTNLLLKSVGLTINPEEKVGSLNVYKKIALEIIKAKIEYSKLIIIDHVSSFLSNSEIVLLHSLIKRLSNDGMSFIYICNHHQEAFLISQRCYLMKEGRIIKNLFQYEMTQEIMTHYSFLFEKRIDSPKRKELYKNHNKAILSCIFNKVTYGSLNKLTMNLYSNETIVLLDSDNSIINDLTTLLKANEEPQSGFIFLNNCSIKKGDRQIAIIDKEYPASALFKTISVIDNILFCTDTKLKSIWINNKIKKSIAKSLESELGQLVYKRDLYDLTKEDLFKILSKKLLFQKPKLVVMIQPFSGLDMYQRIKNIEYMDELKKQGTTLLLLTLTLSDTLQVANKLLIGKKGSIIKEYNRSEFDSLTYLHGSVPK